MEFLKNNARGIVIALLAIGVITAVSVSGNNDESAENAETSEVAQTDEAQENTEENTTEQTEQTEEERATEGTRPGRSVDDSDEVYTVTAEAGDNQTVLVRDIIARYSDSQEGQLSAEQRLYAETNLVNELPRDDVIYVGDTIRLEADVVADVFQQAQNLSDAQIAAWSAYL